MSEEKAEDSIKVPEVSKKERVRVEITFALLDFYIWFSNIFIIYSFFTFFVPEEIFKITFPIAIIIALVIQFLSSSNIDDITQKCSRIYQDSFIKKIPEVYKYKRLKDVELISGPVVLRPIIVYVVMWLFHELFV